jgi:hypothetical protein
LVALAQGNTQGLAKLKDHGATGLGATGFEEAQVALGDAGGEGEVELGEAAEGAPMAEGVGKIGCQAVAIVAL